MHLCDRGNTGCSVLEGVSNFLGLRAASLDAQQPYHRREAVFDALISRVNMA